MKYLKASDELHSLAIKNRIQVIREVVAKTGDATYPKRRSHYSRRTRRRCDA